MQILFISVAFIYDALIIIVEPCKTCMYLIFFSINFTVQQKNAQERE